MADQAMILERAGKVFGQTPAAPEQEDWALLLAEAEAVNAAQALLKARWEQLRTTALSILAADGDLRAEWGHLGRQARVKRDLDVDMAAKLVDSGELTRDELDTIAPAVRTVDQAAVVAWADANPERAQQVLARLLTSTTSYALVVRRRQDA